MPDKINNQKSITDARIPVNKLPGRPGSQGALQLQRPIQEAKITPFIQYPIDDTLPIKSWVFEKHPAARDPAESLQPEDDQKALEAINSHLLPPEQVKITQDSCTSTAAALKLRPALYPGTHLPLPPQCWDRRDREEAARPPGSPRPAKPAKSPNKKTPRRVASRNWTETEDKKDKENEWTEGWEDQTTVVVVPEIILTRADGKTRRLQDPNTYLREEDGGSGGYFW